MKETEKTQAQKKFLDEYSKTLDIKQSAKYAGFKRQTAVAVAKNMLNSPRWQEELDNLCETKAKYLDITKAYIVKRYISLINWALDKDSNGGIKDAAIALRSLDSLVKQLSNAPKNRDDEPQSFLTSIQGLNTDKI